MSPNTYKSINALFIHPLKSHQRLKQTMQLETPSRTRYRHGGTPPKPLILRNKKISHTRSRTQYAIEDSGENDEGRISCPWKALLECGPE